MNTLSIHFKAQRVTRFVCVQFVALAGWVVVQLFFSLSPFGRALPFVTLLLTEAVWWIALLLLMLRLFLLEYHRFVRAALDLEDANTRLRQRTTTILHQLRMERFPEDPPSVFPPMSVDENEGSLPRTHQP